MKRSRTIRRALESFGEALKKDEGEDNRSTVLLSLKLSTYPMPSLGKWPLGHVFVSDESNWMRHNDLASSIDEPILSAVIPSSPLFSSLSCSSSEASLSSSSEKKRKKSESFDYTWLDEHDEVDDLANAFAFTAVESSHA